MRVSTTIRTRGDARAPSRIDVRADAFRRMVAGELQRSYRLAAVMLGDSVDAEDAVHDAAVLAWTRFGSLRDPERFEAWFGRILLNVCRDRLRRRQRRTIAELAVADRDSTTNSRAHDPSASFIERSAMQTALDGLDPDHLAVIVLRHEFDLTVPAIAERLGLAEGTVKSRLHHAHRRLRVAIEANDR